MEKIENMIENQYIIGLYAKKIAEKTTIEEKIEEYIKFYIIYCYFQKKMEEEEKYELCHQFKLQFIMMYNFFIEILSIFADSKKITIKKIIKKIEQKAKEQLYELSEEEQSKLINDLLSYN